MAGDINVLVHRERVHATDNPITIRPTGLSGITPKAVYAFCSADFDADGTIGADAGFAEGFTDGTNTYSRGVFEVDAVAASEVRTWQSTDLLQIINADAGTELLALDSPSLVSGGLNLTPSTRTNLPTVTYVFFYGADLQAAAGAITGFDAGGGDGGGDTVAVTTGLSGSNLDNQLILFMGGYTGPTWTSSSVQSLVTCIAPGAAYRDGIAGAPAGQWAANYTARNNTSVGRCENTVRTDRVVCHIQSGALNKTYSCSDISDATFTVQAFGTAANTPIAWLALETDTKQAWCGVEDSSTTGTWTVTTPGWEPGFLMTHFTQATALSAIKTSDLDVYGAAVATADDQSCQTASNEDAAANMVCKSLASDKFLDALEDDGTSGWEQAATGDFVFSATGWTVSNITVGTAGASARKFPCIAMEVAAAAAGGITSEASPGTLTLAGVAADQVVTTNIDASATPGAVTLAGVAADVDITSGLTYEATAGALQVTGVDADAAITENLNLDATAASLVLTGQAADIVVDVSYTLEATPGALTLTGQTADFVVAAPSTSVEAEATPGALSLTGQAATVDILTALSLEATPGAIVFTGAKATVQGLVSAVAAPKTGGRPSRTIYLGKKRYQVQNRAQEEALVRDYVAELERAHDMAAVQDEPVKAKAVKRRIKLARTRLRKLEEPDPVESLKRLDDEILTLLGGTPWL